jgi:hypothetical protein
MFFFGDVFLSQVRGPSLLGLLMTKALVGQLQRLSQQLVLKFCWGLGFRYILLFLFCAIFQVQGNAAVKKRFFLYSHYGARHVGV